MLRANNRESGFTLLELILSLTVVVVLAAVCLVGIRLALASRDAGTQKADAFQRLRVLHEQMTRSIRSAHLIMIPKPSDSLIDGDAKAKASNSKVLAFEGKTDSLKFVTFSQPLTGTGPTPWMHQIHIFLKRDPFTGESDIILEERDFSADTFLEDAEDNDDSIQTLRLAQDVAYLKFRYYQPSNSEEDTDGNQGSTETDSTGEWVEEILPELFEIKNNPLTEEENVELKEASLPQLVEITAGLWNPSANSNADDKTELSLPPMLIPLHTAVAFEEKQKKEAEEDEAAVTK